MHDAYCDAKEQAIELREMFERLSAFEKIAAAKQIAAVERLVMAVEAL
ncbi:protein of unknown function [Burkholderia multivorans]